MLVRRYDKNLDYGWLKEIGGGWGSRYSPEQFPEVGFVVEGLAAFFVYQTDSAVCFLENLISKRTASDEDRNLAIHLVTKAAVDWVQESPFLVAYATTDNQSVIARARCYGAIGIPGNTLLVKKFKKQTSQKEGDHGQSNSNNTTDTNK